MLTIEEIQRFIDEDRTSEKRCLQGKGRRTMTETMI